MGAGIRGGQILQLRESKRSSDDKKKCLRGSNRGKALAYRLLEKINPIQNPFFFSLLKKRHLTLNAWLEYLIVCDICKS